MVSIRSFEQVKQLPEVKFLGGRSHPNVIKLLEVVRAKDHVCCFYPKGRVLCVMTRTANVGLPCVLL